MTVAEILDSVNGARGTNAKLAILRVNRKNESLKKALEYGLDTYRKFGVVKVPVTEICHVDAGDGVWDKFFDVLDLCAARTLTGRKAVNAIQTIFACADEPTEHWMRRILLKHFNIGASRKTVFKVWGGLVKTFAVQLAAKWHDGTLDDLPKKVRVEPKLDGVRLVSIVRDGKVEMLSRAGKVITNFQDTVGKELSTLPDGVYDGEIMDEDFNSLMRQVHRKVKTNVSKSYYMLFDVVSLEEWEEREGQQTLAHRRQKLETILGSKEFEFLRLIEHKEIDSNFEAIMAYHGECTAAGFEGAMLKNPTMPYCFGRSDAVVKVKAFNDVDLRVTGFLEGRGRHKGSLGAILVNFNGVKVRVGSGFGDTDRAEVWADKEKFLGMTAEIRYQEITPDGSLRFPTFVCWRTDK
jgi:DNA ligase-1